MVNYRYNQTWESVLEVSAIELKAQVTKLEEKSELQFRITAVNEAGPSLPSEPTLIHTVKHKPCKYLNLLKCILIVILCLFSAKPIIDRSNLKNCSVSRGKTVTYDVHIKGEPAPIVKWKFADNDVCLVIFYLHFFNFIFISRQFFMIHIN